MQTADQESNGVGYSPSYRYWILIFGFLCTFVSIGIGTYTFSLFIRFVEAELSLARAAAMGGITFFFIGFSLASPLVGRCIDMYGAKKTVVGGALLAGSSYIFLGQMHALWIFYLGYSLNGVGMSACSQIPATAVVSTWFQKRRGLAIGIVSSGIGVGGIVIAPITGGLLIPAFGWRNAFMILGCLTWLLLIPPALLILKTNPPGRIKDKEWERHVVGDTVAPAEDGGIHIREALRTSTLWLIFLSFFTLGFSQAGFFHNQVPFLQEVGITAIQAANIFGLVGLGSAVGKFGFGWLCDFVRAKWAACLSILFQAASMGIALTATEETPVPVFCLSAVFLGLGIGGNFPTLSILTSTMFGLRSYGSIFGIFNFALFISCSFGPIIGGYLRDTSGAYTLVFKVFSLFYAVAVLAILILPRREKVKTPAPTIRTM